MTSARARTNTRPARLTPAEADALIAASPARPQIRAAPTAGEVATRLLRTAAGGRAAQPTLKELHLRWGEIVGPSLAALSQPDKRVRGRGGDTLSLIAAGPAALLIQAQAQEILARVNLYAGGAPFARLAVRQGVLARASRPGAAPTLPPAQEARLDASLAAVADPRLRAALRRLGARVLSQGASFR